MVRQQQRIGGRLGILLGAFLALAGLSGCTTTVHESFTLDFPITSEAVALDVDNFRGSVDVRVDPFLDEFVVESDIVVRHGIEREKIPEVERAVEVDADLVRQDGRSVLRIRTSTDRRKTEDHRVNLFIRMPRCDGLYIKNYDGMVELVNVRGAMEVHNRLGHVEVRTSHPIREPVTITTVDGNIYYQVPPGSTGVFDLEALEGEVRFVDRVGGMNASQHTSRKRYEGRVNEGTNRVLCRTNRGVVQVWIMEDPVDLTRSVHPDAIHFRDLLFLKGSRRHTRNLPDDHPEVQADSHSDPEW